MITNYIRADAKNQTSTTELLKPNKERSKILDRAFRMPAGEVSASSRLRNYQVKRMKEDVHKNRLIAETETKFRKQFDDEFIEKVKPGVKTPLSVTRRLSISKQNSDFRNSRFRFTMRNPMNVSGIKDKTFHLATKELAKIKSYPGANLHSDPVHTTHNLYKQVLLAAIKMASEQFEQREWANSIVTI